MVTVKKIERFVLRHRLLPLGFTIESTKRNLVIGGKVLILHVRDESDDRFVDIELEGVELEGNSCRFTTHDVGMSFSTDDLPAIEEFIKDMIINRMIPLEKELALIDKRLRSVSRLLSVKKSKPVSS
jgi:hypothetical protein